MAEGNYLTTKINEVVAWGRKYSLWPLPFGTACCAIEFMGTVSNMFDISRFGAELVRFSPRQSDLLLVLGTVNYKQAAILKKIYQQMADPKYVIAVGACATCGGFYDNYAVVQGIDEVIPVDVYVPGCPPRPEQILLAIIKLQEKLEKAARGEEAHDVARARPEILESDKHPEFHGTFIK
jgi:NADH-quinone oxidoreductase subunit B